MTGVVLCLAVLLAPAPQTRRVPVTDGTVAMDEAGGGPAVVLLHGAFLDRGTWDAQMPALAARHRAVRYDIRPFGESSLPAKPYQPIDDLRELLDALKIEKAHLVGHSFGGGVAIDFALAHPDRVGRLVLVNSGVAGAKMPADEQKEAGQVFVAARESEAKAVEAWMRLGLWAASRDRPEVMSAIERNTARNARLFRLSSPPFAPVQPPAAERLGELRVPTLVVAGDRDTPGNRAASETLASGIPGARLVVIPGADHAIPIGWASELNAVLLEFLEARPRR